MTMFLMKVYSPPSVWLLLFPSLYISVDNPLVSKDVEGVINLVDSSIAFRCSAFNSEHP